MRVETLRRVPTAEPGMISAGILAILVHVFFIGLMVFGLNWKAQPPEGMVVDLWQDLPHPITEPKVSQPQPEPEPKPQPATEPPKQQTVPDEIIKVAPPPQKKPDIPLKKTVEQPTPPQIEPVEEVKPDPEALKKQQQERMAAEKAAQEKAEAERVQREKEEQRKREQAAQAVARAQVASEVAKYKAMIMAKIRSRIVMPPDLPGNPVTEFRVTLLPGGDILHVMLHKSSGYAVFDQAVERAIHLSKPLPLPPDPALFSEFRHLNVTVHYLE